MTSRVIMKLTWVAAPRPNFCYGLALLTLETKCSNFHGETLCFTSHQKHVPFLKDNAPFHCIFHLRKWERIRKKNGEAIILQMQVPRNILLIMSREMLQLPYILRSVAQRGGFSVPCKQTAEIFWKIYLQVRVYCWKHLAWCTRTVVEKHKMG